MRRLMLALLGILMLVMAGAVYAHTAPPVIQHDDDDEDRVVTYWHDVKPILEANCTSCHQQGEIGGFPLMTYADAVDAAPVIGETVLTGYMPPWPPGGDSPHLVGERSLTPEEIDTLVRWAFTVEEGDPAEYVPPVVEPLPEIRPDMMIEMPEPYLPNDELSDDYRCFLVDPGVTEDTFITGYDIIPGEPSVVHHVLLFKVPASARAQAERLQAEDDRLGWQCFGGPRTPTDIGGRNGLSGSASLADSIGAWAPGTPATFFPPGTGDLLRTGDLVVMQVHYNLELGTSLDQTRAILQTEPADGSQIALASLNMVGPVELPCAPGNSSDLCDRDAALAEAGMTPGNERAQRRANGLLLMCGHDVDDFTSQDASNIVSDCDRRLQVDGFAFGSAGHMHELGTAIRLDLNPDTPDAQNLLDIPEWDFHWQGTYQYMTPIPVSRGDVVRITCTWDNSENDRYVVWGEGTQDEMCLGGVTILPLPQGVTHDQFRAERPDLFVHAQDDPMHMGSLEIAADDPVPTLSAEVMPGGDGRHILLLDVTHFSFAPDAVDTAHAPGQGHAHLYINGEKVGRVFNTAYDLGRLEPGSYEIRVELNSNDHRVLVVDGSPVETTITLTVSE